MEVPVSVDVKILDGAISCQQLASPHSLIICEIVSLSLIPRRTWNPLSELMWYGMEHNSIKESVGVKGYEER